MRNWAGNFLAGRYLSGHGTWRAHKDYRSRSSGRRKGADLHRLGCYHQAVKIFKASRRSSVRHHDFPPDAKTVLFSFASQFIADVPADKRPS